MLDDCSSHSRRLSCGAVLLTGTRELLLCHVTGQRHWDLPKGGIHADERPLQAALRETREESGLELAAEAALDLGRHAYTAKKDLHLFAFLAPRFDTRLLRCDSFFVERGSGRHRPEMDGFGWFAFSRVADQCTPKMAELLTSRIDLDAVLESLRRRAEPLAA
ncbi:MAG TPA: NUDIX hydrolase [Caldimonas sp.]|nr:NUDIX hydrolase [Caldimonas sp.]HEX2540767.1 NUDIX hydrolase [Caldimonas sp.]